jgi:formate-dependent nitrite reductase membrane component NrfD
MVSIVLWLFGYRDLLTTLVGPAIALTMVSVTAAVLVLDLEQPRRFLYILTRPNWNSWLARGAFILTAFGGLTTAWLGAAWLGWDQALMVLAWPALVAGFFATIYTGFLFAQGLARDLWQGPHSTIDLLAQAVAEGAGVMLLASLVPAASADAAVVTALSWTLFAALGAHLVLILIEHLLMPSATLHHELAVRAIRTGAFARVFWGGAVVCGLASLVAVPLVPVAALLALVAPFAWEYVWVEAGQSVPLS